jgi:hypothetical protein
MIVLSGLVSATAFALPLCTTFGYLDELITSGGCTQGSITFSNFSYTPVGGAPAATAVGVGFGFTGGAVSVGFGADNLWSVGTDENMGGEIQYDLACPDCWNVSLTMFENDIGFFDPDGSTQVQKTLTGGASANLSVVANQGGTTQSDGPDVFAPVASFTVTDVLTVQGGTKGKAKLDSFVNVFEIPEPMTFVLFGSGLLGIGLLRRRSKKS